MITKIEGKRKTSYSVRVGQVYGGAFDTLEAAQAKEAELKASGANKSAFDQLMDKIVELEHKIDEKVTSSKEYKTLKDGYSHIYEQLVRAEARIDELKLQKKNIERDFHKLIDVVFDNNADSLAVWKNENKDLMPF